jgi:hypothetical protein
VRPPPNSLVAEAISEPTRPARSILDLNLGQFRIGPDSARIQPRPPLATRSFPPAAENGLANSTRHSLLQTLAHHLRRHIRQRRCRASTAEAIATSRRWPASSTSSTAGNGHEQQRTGEALGASNWPLPTTCSTIRPGRV